MVALLTIPSAIGLLTGEATPDRPFAKRKKKSKMARGDPSSRQPMVNKDIDWRLYSVLSILVRPPIRPSAAVIRQIAPSALASFSSLIGHSARNPVQDSDVII